MHTVATDHEVLSTPQTQPETNNINKLSENNSLDIELFLSITDINNGKIQFKKNLWMPCKSYQFPFDQER